MSCLSEVPDHRGAGTAKRGSGLVTRGHGDGDGVVEYSSLRGQIELANSSVAGHGQI